MVLKLRSVHFSPVMLFLPKLGNISDHELANKLGRNYHGKSSINAQIGHDNGDRADK